MTPESQPTIANASSGRKTLLFGSAIFVLALLALAAWWTRGFGFIRKSPEQIAAERKQTWLRASDELRLVAKGNFALQMAMGAGISQLNDSRSVSRSVMSLIAFTDAKKCLELADRLETFAKFEQPRLPQFNDVLAEVTNLRNATENVVNPNSNSSMISNMAPKEREMYLLNLKTLNEVKDLLIQSEPDP